MTNIANLFRWLNKLLPWISKVCIFISSIALVLLLALFGWLVFGRYVLNVTPTWVEQFSLLLVVYITFLGAAAGVHEETHLGVNFIREGMPDFIRRPLRIICDLCLVVFGIIMFDACLELAMFGWATKLAMLEIPEGIRTLPAAICGLLVAVFSAAHAISRIHSYYFADATAVKQDAQ